jgi:glutamate synthase (ferredoxin)
LEEEAEKTSLTEQQKTFGYTFEDIYQTIQPMALNGSDPVGSMGMDSPLAVLSENPQMLYLYFKQLFAQVTNPPIDGIREEIVTSSSLPLGVQGICWTPTTAMQPLFFGASAPNNKQLHNLRRFA